MPAPFKRQWKLSERNTPTFPGATTFVDDYRLVFLVHDLLMHENYRQRATRHLYCLGWSLSDSQLPSLFISLLMNMDSLNIPRRRKPGRDPKGAQAQGAESLGAGKRTPRERRSFNLVVYGAINYKHGFIFSDFMGFCMALLL
jgi:hypothetical protein